MLYTIGSQTYGICTNGAGKKWAVNKAKRNRTGATDQIKQIKQTASAKNDVIPQDTLPTACTTSGLFCLKAESPAMYSSTSRTSFNAAIFFCNFRSLRGFKAFTSRLLVFQFPNLSNHLTMLPEFLLVLI